MALTVTVPEGFQSDEVTIKFEDTAFSKKINFCSALITRSGDNMPCLDSSINAKFPKFKKVFSHDASGGVFASDAAVNESNPSDENAALFSILNTVQDYKKPDGTYHFKLCYPGNSCYCYK